MLELVRDIVVCQDCLILIANGDETPDTDMPLLGILAPADIVLLGLAESEHSCDYPTDWQSGDCECEQHEFSRVACGACGTQLDGYRHDASIYRESVST